MKRILLILLVAVTAGEAIAQQPVRNSDASVYTAGRLSMTPATARQTPVSSFGEKVAGGLQAGANARTVNDSSKGVPAKPGGAVSSSYAAGRLSMTPTTVKQTQGLNFGEKVAQGMAAHDGHNPLYEGEITNEVDPMYDPARQARPGQPIKGVIVKGGHNPGGHQLTILSNDKGEFELNGLEPGNYRFTLTGPDARQRHGVVVQGGKNSGEAMTGLTVGENGEIQFEVLEAGDYRFIIQAADETRQGKPGLKQGNITEKTGSGLKDTLKTNV
ncbi:carboxypeptidase-like regulatory domain-containing protein [Niabella drilacis]|uniref:Carboxypeptidase regulatory-like domain-containing protein n=1 Tax=Niabella drilacis (strain DSM 25811 / CCM 8410 / CCUG 62505 / LMG 26954 / E90) TaxID=1285928 RepID=A0A1G6R0I8_NIADE|nr:carboxypeptidase-like regulatory domain-containing protein [Niabella drilacis]SDC98011.1 hypothetical protein SAMN04487894_10594 [Niabella drilacis]